MKINFKGKTNQNSLLIDALKVQLASGGEIILDRDNSTNEVVNGRFTMTWNNVYVWDGEKRDYGSPAFLVNGNEKVEFVFEDEANSDDETVIEDWEPVYTIAENQYRDNVYRSVKEDFIVADIESFLEDNPEEFSVDKEQINRAAYLFAYEGEHDCNLTYWDNIRGLLLKVS